MVEPIFGIIAVLIAGAAGAVMPWLLSFAAGAMMYVVVEELIPRSASGGAFQYRHYRRNSWVSVDDDSGCGIGLRCSNDK